MEPELTTVLNRYGIRAAQTELLGGGLINPTYKIWVAGAPYCILQKLNPVVFPKPGAIMENLEQVLPFLQGEGYAATELLVTTDGRAWISDADLGYWRAYRFIPHTRTYPNSTDPTMAGEAGRILGTFHRLLRDFPIEKLHTHLPGFHNLGKRSGELDNAARQAEPGRVGNAGPWLDLAAGLIEDCSQIPLDSFPIRVCHNDPVMKNVLYHDDRPEALCLIDLDTIMPGYLIWDFGDAARSVVTARPEDYRGSDAIRPDPDAYAAFARGFLGSGLELSAPELEWLPKGLVLMPLLHGIRALADYLAGDLYYKCEYPEQNLIRARNLLSLAGASKEALPGLEARMPH